MKTTLLAAAAIAACLVAGCAPPAANTGNTANANSNANAKSAGAAPTVAALKELETKAFEAYKNKDGKFFEGLMDEKFVMGGMAEHPNKAASIKEISEHKCEIKSFTLSDEKMIPLGADAAAFVAKVTADGTCPDDKGVQQKMPTPSTSATVYVRSGDTWKAAYHNEVMVVDPKAATTAPADPAKPAEAKPEAKKEEAKPADTNKAANTASNTAASNTAASNTAASTSGDMTAAWLDLEKKGWEAWQKKDAAYFESTLSSNFIFIDPMGTVTASKADTIKLWATENKCDVKSTSVTDATSVSLGKDVGILMFKGSGTGTCEGTAIKPLFGTTVYVNEGGTWRAALIMENPA